jgi:putative tryptophan/tyrosine transport system substrate-binding protein
MRRRDFLLGAAIATSSLGCWRALGQGKPLRIGWVAPGPGQLVPSFHDGMRDVGYREGKSYVIDERYANDPRGLTAAINDLLNPPVDLFFAIGVPIVRAVAAATQSIPIVVIGNPILAGVADSLARPGRNVTGLSLAADDFSTKWLELLRELDPALRRLIVLYEEGTVRQASDLKTATEPLGLASVAHAVRGPADIEAAIRGGDVRAGDALVVPASSYFAQQRTLIVALAREMRLPAIYEHRLYVEHGGLVSYGPDIRDVFRRAAYYVDRVFKGAKPAELPIELPTKFELVLNLKTAKELGLTVSQAMLSRADEVIE